METGESRQKFVVFTAQGVEIYERLQKRGFMPKSTVIFATKSRWKRVQFEQKFVVFTAQGVEIYVQPEKRGFMPKSTRFPH